ncbi:MAG TPA: tripartite tricarboxylate transporter substrate binding protein [Burkholderiales bacterium]|nr:tripartite tricarboxylate transporter substrate binding protein [Burkholderiales bacterium]
MNKRNCIGTSVAIAALAMICAAAPVQSQPYPSKPVRLIVPFPPGGGTDTMARVLGPKLGEALGQQVLIDNRGGAGATIGTELAAKAPADGYTMLLMTVTNAVGMALYPNLKFDLVRDFAPVTRLATTPHVLVVHPSVPAKTVKELVALAKARPGQLVYSSSGTGTVSHLAGEYFGFLTGTKMLHVPYKGGGPSVSALLGGEVSVGFATLPSVVSFIKSGKLRGIAMTTAQRSPTLPDLPTVGDAGIANYDVGSWYGLSVPTGTPKEAIARLHEATHKVLVLPDTRERLAASGFDIIVSSPEQYGEFVRVEVERWAKVVKMSGAKAD